MSILEILTWVFSILAIAISVFGILFPSRARLDDFKCSLFGHNYVKDQYHTRAFCTKCGMAEK